MLGWQGSEGMGGGVSKSQVWYGVNMCMLPELGEPD